jgi:hypothetical protein
MIDETALKIARKRYWRDNPPRCQLTRHRQKLDQLRALRWAFKRDQKWKQVLQTMKNRVEEVRPIFEAVTEQDSSGRRPSEVTVGDAYDALMYLYGVIDAKPDCVAQIPEKA